MQMVGEFGTLLQLTHEVCIATTGSYVSYKLYIIMTTHEMWFNFNSKMIRMKPKQCLKYY